MPNPLERRVQLLSKGPLLLERQYPQPGRPGTHQIYHNGLGRYFVGRPIVDANQRLTIEYAPDADSSLELSATRIRRDRFAEPPYDQDSTFPITRRLAYAAYPDIRPKKQQPRESEDERMERHMYDHLDDTSQAWNV